MEFGKASFFAAEIGLGRSPSPALLFYEEDNSYNIYCMYNIVICLVRLRINPSQEFRYKNLLNLRFQILFWF